MFGWFKKHIKLPLEFSLDLDAQGRHVIETFINIDGKKEKIKNISEIWNYGYNFERNKKNYIISLDSLEILHSIRSLNPIVTDDGKLISEVCPPILKYIRSKKNYINESERSKTELKISDKPLKPGANVDYDPKKGLIVETGYRQEGKSGLIDRGKINITEDGNYARIDNTFFPVSEKKKEPDIENWLNVRQHTIDHNNIPEFFKRDLVLLKSKLGAILTDKANAIEIVDEPLMPKVSVRKNEPGWLDFEINYIAGGFELPSYLIKKAKSDYICPDDYKWIHIDKSVTKGIENELHKLGAEQTTTGFRIPITQFFSLEEFIEKIGGIKEVTAEYKKFLDEITDFKTDENYKLPGEIESCLDSHGINLRPYQRAGVHWLSWLTNHYLHGILADDMGLGKTIQTITTIRLFYEKENIQKHSLIICPKSVVHFWNREIKRGFPQARIYEYIGSSRNGKLFDNPEAIIFITTYETIVRDKSFIHSVPFYFVVLDEATKIKNPDTLRTKIIKGINSLHRIALSGTPIENRPAELWSLFDFLMRGHLGTYSQFVNFYEKPITLGNNDSTNTLSKRIRPFILRRLKKNVAKDLPEKIEIDEWVELTDEQKFLYSQIQSGASQLRDAIQRGENINYSFCILPILTKLKQVCDHPAIINGKDEPVENRSEKFDLVIDKILEIHEAGEHVVLFSHFLRTLDLFEIVLNSKGIKYIRLDGSTQDRQTHIDKFNQKQVDVALCSIQACGHGINLTAANHVIHVDRWWNPAVEDQATDRVHRIGQNKTVYVYRILTKGTLEEKIANLLEKKRDISDKVIGYAVRQEMRWTREELLEILKPLE